MSFLSEYQNNSHSFLSRVKRAGINFMLRIFPPAIEMPPIIEAYEPESEKMVNVKRDASEIIFGKSEMVETRTTLMLEGKPLDVMFRRDNKGNVELRPMTEMVRRSKPSGVSQSSGNGGAAGITNVTGRVSQDVQNFGGIAPFSIFSKSSFWRNFVLTDNISLAEIRDIPIDKISELLAVVSPEVSNGLYVRTIFSNSGYTVEALKMDSDEVDQKAQKELDAMRAIVASQNGTEDVFFNRLFITYFLRGAILSEIVFAENGRDFAGIVTPDPSTLQFRRIPHPTLGTIWDFGQLQNGQYVSLNVETMSYVPLNPFTDSIEGQPLVSSSFFIAIFMMAVLRDFKRVIQQQGYPRYDIEIDLEKLKNVMPSEANSDSPDAEKVFQAWSASLFAGIQQHLRDLQPDETFVHFSGVKVNQPVGAMGTNALTSIDGLFKGLERMAARALKVPPVLMGITDSVNETNANRQFEAFFGDIESGQHTIENSIGGHYQMGLLAKGIIARVQVRFNQMRASERIRDAQADLLAIQVASQRYQQGWISQDEAAKLGANVDVADVPEPRQAMTTTQAVVEPHLDNSVNRLTPPENVRAITLQELAKAKEIFEQMAPAEAEGLIFADKTEN